MFQKYSLLAILFSFLVSPLGLPCAVAAEKCEMVFKVSESDTARREAIQLIRNFFDQPAANHEIKATMKAMNDGEVIVESYSGVEFKSEVNRKMQIVDLDLTLMLDHRSKGEIMFSIEEKASRIRWAELSSLHWINDVRPLRDAFREDQDRVNILDLLAFQGRAVNSRNRIFTRNNSLIIETLWPKASNGRVLVVSVEFVKNENSLLVEIIHERREIQGSKTISVQNHYSLGPVQAEQIH